MRLPLSRDAEILLGEGAHSNLLVIEGGKAAVTEASCPDHVCVEQGWVGYTGQAIVCLPNKLVVSIEGAAAPELDGIAG